MRSFLLIPFLFLVNLHAFAQQATVLEGKLIDSLSTEPLAYATIKLVEGEFIKGEIADASGNFKFKDLKSNKYLIVIEYVGYKTKYIEVSASKNLDLGAISLVPLSQLLDGVTVTGLKSNMVATLEKQVFRSDQYEVARGGTATDVLKNIPSVMVNAEGEITVRGSKGFQILVNGKPSQIESSVLLSQIPANTIEKIEMITAPSAKYDADGKAGIINIVTKSGTNDGWSTSTNMMYGLPRIVEYENEREPKRFGSDLSVNFRQRKWDIATSINYLRNDIAGRRVGDVNTTLNQIFTQFPSEGERSLRRESYGIRSSITYQVNKNNELSTGVYFGKKDQFRLADIFYQNSKTDLQTNSLISQTNYFNSNLVRKSGSFRVFNLDFIHHFSDKSNIKVSALSEQAQLDGFTKNRNLNATNYLDTIQYTLNLGQNPLHALRIKADFEKNIGQGKFSAGYQFRNQIQNGEFSYAEKQGNFTPLITNPAFSAAISVKNRIHAVYTQYSGSYQKWEYALGLRSENAFRRFEETQSENPIYLKLSNLFPSANLLFNMNSTLRFKVSYSRRVQRSTNNELNPYPEREHSETLEQGDPHIRPEFIGIYEAGMVADFKKASFYWNVYKQQITDIVNRVNSVYNDTILNRIYTNTGNARQYGSELGLTYKPIKKLKVFVGGNMYNLRIKGEIFDKEVNIDSRGWVYSVNSNINCELSNTWTTQFNLTYLSARNTAQGIDSRFYQPNFSLKKSFDKNKLSLTLNWQNAAFGKMKVNEQRITTFGSNFYTTTNYIQERNIFILNLSYNFRNSEAKPKLPNSEFGEKEF